MNTSGSLSFCRPVPLPIFPVTRGKVTAQAQFLVETWRTKADERSTKGINIPTLFKFALSILTLN